MLTNASKDLSLTRIKNAHIENYNLLTKSRVSWEICNPRKLKKDRVSKTLPAFTHTTYLGWLVSCQFMVSCHLIDQVDFWVPRTILISSILHQYSVEPGSLIVRVTVTSSGWLNINKPGELESCSMARFTSWASSGAKELTTPIWFHQNVIRWASFEYQWHIFEMGG